MKAPGKIGCCLRSLPLLLGVGAFLAACGSGGLTTLVDGPTGLAVGIKPLRSVVPFGERLLFTAQDGVPPYVFTLVTGGGTLDASSGAYVAPSTRGTATIRVTDASTGTADALVSIVDPGVVVLGIDPSALTLSINTQATFSAFGGVPPYAFSVASGGGSVASATGLYTAPLSAGTVVVRVTDAAASTADATVTVHSAGVLLGIRPTTLVVSVSGSATFYPVGGAAPYAFALSTNGSGAGAAVNPTTGLYVAGPSAGADVVTVTDGAGASVQATITVVQLATTVDYRVPAVSLPATGNAGAAMAAGSFTLENLGLGAGSKTVSWGVYLSADATLDAGDVLAASGTRSALAAGATATVNAAGTFPAIAAGSWTWIVAVDAADDVVKTNNAATASLALSSRDVDYAVSSVANTGGATAGTALTGTFTLTNNGTQAGIQPIYWTAYVSSNATLEIGTDTVIDSGNRAALAAGAAVTGTAFGGAWPAAPGTWRLIVRAGAADDVGSGNDTGVSAAVPVAAPDVDYTVTGLAVTSPASGAAAGPAWAGTFTVTNGGTFAGGQKVYWTAYLSVDAVLQIGTDRVLDSGSLNPLAAGAASAATAFGGTWTSTAGTWYVIVKGSAGDDVSSANDVAASGAILVNP